MGWYSPLSSRVQVARGGAVSLVASTPGEAQASVERLSASREDASTPWLAASPPSAEARSFTRRPSAARPLAGRRVAPAPLQHPLSALSAAERVARAGRAREATLARLAQKEPRDDGGGRHATAGLPHARVVAHASRTDPLARHAFSVHVPESAPAPEAKEPAASGAPPSARCHITNDFIAKRQHCKSPTRCATCCHLKPSRAVNTGVFKRVRLTRSICLNLATLAAAGALVGKQARTASDSDKLPWREAGPFDHHDDSVDSDQ